MTGQYILYLLLNQQSLGVDLHGLYLASLVPHFVYIQLFENMLINTQASQNL